MRVRRQQEDASSTSPVAPAPRKTRKHVIKSLRSICECFRPASQEEEELACGGELHTPGMLPHFVTRRENAADVRQHARSWQCVLSQALASTDSHHQ